MDLSLGEFRALVAKAFRGAGYSWGLTEEAAFAAGRLASSGLPAGEIVVRLLQAIDQQPVADLMPDEQWSGQENGLCPVCVGTTLADQGGCDGLELGPTLEPVLLAPFLGSTLDPSANGSYTITWDDGSCIVGAERGTGGLSITLVGDLATMAGEVTIQQSSTPPVEADPTSRIEIDDATANELDRFAHRVYAPATDESRAGAGPT